MTVKRDIDVIALEAMEEEYTCREECKQVSNNLYETESHSKVACRRVGA